jgi:hypothetical protein
MPTPLSPSVLLVIHNPLVAGSGGLGLQQALGWNDPDTLAESYRRDVAEISHGLVTYRVVDRVEVDGIPVKADGFRYTADQYWRNWQRRSGWHHPDTVDYHAFLNEFRIVERVDQGEIDEVWWFGAPYFGYYESRMAGPGSIWCNAPPMPEVRSRRRFVIMGFSYERGVGEMLENLGHRAESILEHVYAGVPAERNLWARFTRYDKTHPGQAECGNVHFAPNSERDYDWGNRRPVICHARAWRNFPDLDATAQRLTCAEWGHGDIRAHHKWWFSLFPHVDGEGDGVAWNWWQLVCQY